jgi:phospholipase C
MNPHQKADDPIKHVVLLLFENHSFDQMLGSLKQVYHGLEGVDPANPAINHVAVQIEAGNAGFIWFSSVPGPTWTNRFFPLSGTSSGVMKGIAVDE